MKIYHYNKLGEYTGITEARLDPLEKKNGVERWLLPANATFEEPPKCRVGEVAIIVNGKWSIDKVTIIKEVVEESIVMPEPDPMEIMIMDKMREIAISALKAEGKL
jgi:hypothetical protein